MFNQILAGILAGSGWLISYFLHKWTEEELSFAKKLNLSFRNYLMLSAIFGLIIGFKIIITYLLIIFAATLLVGSLRKLKFKQHIILFIIYIIIFLILFVAQLF